MRATERLLSRCHSTLKKSLIDACRPTGIEIVLRVPFGHLLFHPQGGHERSASEACTAPTAGRALRSRRSSSASLTMRRRILRPRSFVHRWTTAPTVPGSATTRNHGAPSATPGNTDQKI